MTRIKPGKTIACHQATLAEIWYHGIFEGCPESAYNSVERVDTCLKRQETSAAVMCCQGRCDTGLKVKETMGNLSVFEIRKKVGDR